MKAAGGRKRVPGTEGPRVRGRTKADGRGKTAAAYLLILWNRRRTVRRVGRLGRVEFEPGFYVYVGSGGVSVLKRIQRHLRPSKPRRWHVDCLTSGPGRMRPVDAYVLPGFSECPLAQRLGRRLATVRGFGSSDCRCAGHLYYAPGLGSLQAAVNPLVAGPGRAIAR